MSFIQSTKTYQPIKGAAIMLLAFLVSTGGMLTAAISYGNAEQEPEQGTCQHAEHHGPDFSNIADKLHITAEQKKQLESAFKSHQQERKASHQKLRKRHESERKETHNAHKKALQEDLAAFLSEEQIIQLQQNLRKNRPHSPCKPRCDHNTASEGPS